MSNSAPLVPATPTPSLKLEAALQLLSHAGVAVPDIDALGRTAWLQAVIDALCEVSSRDALTGVFNRRQFELALARETDRVARQGDPAMLLVIDIDRFKSVNDTFGHAAGDAVLQAVARVLQDCVRPMDTLARMGGEEFAIILPNCPPAFGQAVAERIRQRVQDTAIDIGRTHPLGVTISVGGAFAPQWVRSSGQWWIERADKFLFQAKAEGRNRVCLEEPLDAVVTAEEKGWLFGTSQFQELE